MDSTYIVSVVNHTFAECIVVGESLMPRLMQLYSWLKRAKCQVVGKNYHNGLRYHIVRWRIWRHKPLSVSMLISYPCCHFSITCFLSYKCTLETVSRVIDKHGYSSYYWRVFSVTFHFVGSLSTLNVRGQLRPFSVKADSDIFLPRKHVKVCQSANCK